MNYLAHAYLSFNQPAILVGNLVSDYVKGKKQFDYPDDIRRGIVLHRAIDTFTDEHPVTKIAKDIFRPYYRLYSAAFIDVVFDHFLANDKQQFTENSLYLFSQEVYATLNSYQAYFPGPFRELFPYMKKYNWLFNYRTRAGIERSFEGLTHRARYISESRPAFTLFEQHYTQLQQQYTQFFPELHQFALDKLKEMGQ